MVIIDEGQKSCINRICIEKHPHHNMKGFLLERTRPTRPSEEYSEQKDKYAIKEELCAAFEKSQKLGRQKHRTKSPKQGHVTIKPIRTIGFGSGEYTSYHLVFNRDLSNQNFLRKCIIKVSNISLFQIFTFLFLQILFNLLFSFPIFSQKMERDSTFKSKILYTSITTSSATASYIALNSLWYKDYPRSKFHFFNDNSEWLQMDKVGHVTTSYNVGWYAYDMMKATGFDENKSLYWGGATGLFYLTGIEILDGFSSQWGFSIGDQIANIGGTSLFILQQKFWKEQRITLKFSYTNSVFANYNPEQLGRNFQQRILKDYNAQTYWSSINISSFLAPDAAFPKFLNIAFGYGASGMTTAKNVVNDVNNFQRTREYYLSFDADLNRVRWPKKWMKKTARILSFIKLPSPTLKMQSDGKVKMYAFYF